jgi:hypothetical protein
MSFSRAAPAFFKRRLHCFLQKTSSTLNRPEKLKKFKSSYEITNQTKLRIKSSCSPLQCSSAKDFPKTFSAVREFTFNSRLIVFVFSFVRFFLFQNHALKRMRPLLASQCMSKDQMLEIIGFVFTHWFAEKSAVALRFQLLFTFQTLLTIDIASGIQLIQRSIKLPCHTNCQRCTCWGCWCAVKRAKRKASRPSDYWISIANIVVASLNAAMCFSVVTDIEMHRGQFAVMNQAKQKSHLL